VVPPPADTYNVLPVGAPGTHINMCILHSYIPYRPGTGFWLDFREHLVSFYCMLKKDSYHNVTVHITATSATRTLHMYETCKKETWLVGYPEL